MSFLVGDPRERDRLRRVDDDRRNDLPLDGQREEGAARVVGADRDTLAEVIPLPGLPGHVHRRRLARLDLDDDLLPRLRLRAGAFEFGDGAGAFPSLEPEVKDSLANILDFPSVSAFALLRH